MENEEIKTLCNMCCSLSMIEKNNNYLEKDYFYIFQLVDGYKKVKNYFGNSITIDKILATKYENITLYNLLRLVRNRHAHVDNHKSLNCYVILKTNVNIEIINELINEINKEIEIIFKKYLNEDYYKVFINTKQVIELFETLKYIINNSKPKSDFEKKSLEEIKLLIKELRFETSSFKDFEKLYFKISDLYNSKSFKDGLIDLYDEKVYNELIKILNADDYLVEELNNLINMIKQFSKD